MAEQNGTRTRAHEDAESKITDRRLFNADGELRAEAAEESESSSEPVEAETSQPDEAASTGPLPDDPGFERRSLDEPQGVDFTMLINAMAEPALLFLGEIAHPGTGQPQLDLERARIQIDMLDLLRVKCRGNLTPEEDSLLDRVLYQLRMLYVSRTNQPDK